MDYATVQTSRERSTHITTVIPAKAGIHRGSGVHLTKTEQLLDYPGSGSVVWRVLTYGENSPHSAHQRNKDAVVNRGWQDLGNPGGYPLLAVPDRRFSHMEPRYGVSAGPLSPVERGNLLVDGVRVCALSLFVSVLLHELAHSLVAIRRGYRVEGITLFLLGGVSSIASESRRAVDDFVISVVGPSVEPCHRSGHRYCRLCERWFVARLCGGRVRRDHQSAAGAVQPAARVSVGRRASAQGGDMGRDRELSPRVGHLDSQWTDRRTLIGGIRRLPSHSGTCAAGDMGGTCGLVPEQGGERKPESGRGRRMCWTG